MEKIIEIKEEGEGVKLRILGKVGGERMKIRKNVDVRVEDMKKDYEGWLKKLMKGEMKGNK